MSLRLRIGALTTVLLLVETASYWKLSHWLSWTNEAWLAYIQGFAFICLLLAAVIAMGSEIPEPMRNQVHVAGVSLFVVQAFANVLMAYQLGLTLVPVAVLIRFFGVDGETAFKAIAIVQGATLSVVSISFWSVIGHLLRQDVGEKQQQRARLGSLDGYFAEVTRE